MRWAADKLAAATFAAIRRWAPRHDDLCPDNFNGVHCVHWQDASGPCCACGRGAYWAFVWKLYWRLEEAAR